jgi:acetyl-CoA acetyltransferase
VTNGQGIAGRTAIVGIGESKYGKRGAFAERTEFSLLLEAIVSAAADAGIPVDEIDGFTSFSFEAHEPVIVQASLGIPELRHSSIVWGGAGGGCCAAVMLAAEAVATGLCRNAVVYRSLCQSQGRRYGQYAPRAAFNSFNAPFGMMTPALYTALTVRRHMYLYGTSREHLCEIATTFRAHAQRNPRAIMYGKPLDRETYFASRMIADPYCLYDCCLETDGACAIIITSAERAADLPQTAARILAAAQGSGPGWNLGPAGTHNMPIESFATVNSEVAGRLLFDQAGLTPADIDVAQIYDAFTGLVPLALEDYGFCERGGAGDFIAAGNLRHDGGSLPTNTAGGLLSEAYLHGLNLVIEGVRQMRGSSTTQVTEARHCLVTSGGGSGHKSGLILGAG